MQRDASKVSNTAKDEQRRPSYCEQGQDEKGQRGTGKEQNNQDEQGEEEKGKDHHGQAKSAQGAKASLQRSDLRSITKAVGGRLCPAICVGHSAQEGGKTTQHDKDAAARVLENLTAVETAVQAMVETRHELDSFVAAILAKTALYDLTRGAHEAANTARVEAEALQGNDVARRAADAAAAAAAAITAAAKSAPDNTAMVEPGQTDAREAASDAACRNCAAAAMSAIAAQRGAAEAQNTELDLAVRCRIAAAAQACARTAEVAAKMAHGPQSPEATAARGIVDVSADLMRNLANAKKEEKAAAKTNRLAQLKCGLCKIKGYTRTHCP